MEETKGVKLIDLGDYVLLKENSIGIELQGMHIQSEKRSGLYHQIVKYTKFTKQPIKLGDFVPCKDGKLLEKPKMPRLSQLPDIVHDVEIEQWEKDKEEYQRALDKCIFEGWENVPVELILASISKRRKIEGLIGVPNLTLTSKKAQELGLSK